MIAIQMDLNYLARYLNISAERIQAYRHKSLEEIVELEAEQGNILAQEYLAKTLRDPNSLLKIFNLIEWEVDLHEQIDSNSGGGNDPWRTLYVLYDSGAGNRFRHL